MVGFPVSAQNRGAIANLVVQVSGYSVGTKIQIIEKSKIKMA
jgi:hypothetical protein